ncbi:MAG: Cell cycle checkpoint protein rad17 [Bathelium mastoideum]|nr:MAG: Cell cycle checkpoint protein rad17 [Bathelium mastoideum]
MGRTRKTKVAVVTSSDEDDQEHVPLPRVLQGEGKTGQTNELHGQKLPNRLKKTAGSSRVAQSDVWKSQGRPFKNANDPVSPNKSVGSAQLSKTKDPSQTRGRKIYSFFNAATQKQQPQLSSSPEKDDVEEAIEEEIEGNGLESSAAYSTHQSATTASRKRARTVWGQSLARSEVGGLPVASQKFLKTRDGKRATSTSVQSSSMKKAEDGPWSARFPPTSLDELAVHKKKVSDVRQWLTGVFAGHNEKRLLVLKGPAGSGKTATILSLAKAITFELTEWKNPSTSDFTSDGYVSVLSHFEDFIGRSGQFGHLELAPTESSEPAKTIAALPTSAQPLTKEAILIEEFPNTFMRSSSALYAFRSTVQTFLAAGTPSLVSPTNSRPDGLGQVRPVIMIISESQVSTSTSVAESFTAQRLLGPEILHHHGTSVIEFNSVAPTILTKALELVIAKDARQSGRRWAPSPQMLRSLAESGDIRSAVSTLEFLCIGGDQRDAWGSKVRLTKSKGALKEAPMPSMEQESLKMITNRASSLDLFHGLGKVLYNKRQDPAPHMSLIAQPPSHLSHHWRRKLPENDVNELMDQIGADVETFVSALHENYALSCNGLTVEDTVDCMDACIDSLSDADLLSPSRSISYTTPLQNTASDVLRHSEISFHVCVRGVLFALPSPVKRSHPPADMYGDQVRKYGQHDAFKMFFPASIKLWKRREELQDLVALLVTRLQRGHYSQPKRKNTVNTLAEDAVVVDVSKGGTDVVRMGSGDSAKTAGLLEYLPYMGIVHRSLGNAAISRELDEVTRFRGIGLVAEDATDDDVVVASGRVGGKVEKLVLSDDDIED